MFTKLVVWSGCFLFLCAGMRGISAAEDEQRVYFGTYTRGDSRSEGIYTGLFSTDTGRIRDVVLAAEADNPSFVAVHPNGRWLFAVSETAEQRLDGAGEVVSYRISTTDGTLTEINRQSSQGGAPCHLVVNASGKFVLVANYVGGNAAVLPIGDDGSLGAACSVVQHEGSGPNARRQEKPHAHSINLNATNDRAYVCDLGTDFIYVYGFDAESGRLTALPDHHARVRAGGGPRHFALAPDRKSAFSNLELTSEVTSLRVGEDGELSPVDTKSTLPDGPVAGNSTAETCVHPGGKTVYVSNRGHDSIAVFRVGPDLKLTQIQVISSGGQVPRNFFVEPSGTFLITANQASDNVAVFRISDDGTLQPISGSSVEVPRPVCIRLLHSPSSASSAAPE